MVVVLKRYSWSLHLVTIALCSYLLAQSISTAISTKLESISPVIGAKPSEAAEQTGVEDQEKPLLEDFSSIGERNIFNSSESAGGGATTDEMVAEEAGTGPAVKTSLDVKLLGTLVVGNGTDRFSSATVSGGTSKAAEVYHPGDEKSFAASVRLKTILKDRIEFINGSRLEYVELESLAEKKTIFASAAEVHGDKQSKDEKGKTEDKPRSASDGDRMVINQSEIDDALSNLDRFYTEVRIVPNFKDGKVSGMKVLSIKPGSIISKLGIRRGDVLAKINGQDLDVKRGMELFNELKDQKNFSIEVTRGGENKTLEYEIR